MRVRYQSVPAQFKALPWQQTYAAKVVGRSEMAAEAQAHVTAGPQPTLTTTVGDSAAKIEKWEHAVPVM